MYGKRERAGACRNCRYGPLNLIAQETDPCRVSVRSAAYQLALQNHVNVARYFLFRVIWEVRAHCWGLRRQSLFKNNRAVPHYKYFVDPTSHLEMGISLYYRPELCYLK